MRPSRRPSSEEPYEVQDPRAAGGRRRRPPARAGRAPPARGARLPPSQRQQAGARGPAAGRPLGRVDGRGPQLAPQHRVAAAPAPGGQPGRGGDPAPHPLQEPRLPAQRRLRRAGRAPLRAAPGRGAGGAGGPGRRPGPDRGHPDRGARPVARHLAAGGPARPGTRRAPHHLAGEPAPGRRRGQGQGRPDGRPGGPGRRGQTAGSWRRTAAIRSRSRSATTGSTSTCATA